MLSKYGQDDIYNNRRRNNLKINNYDIYVLQHSIRGYMS